MTLLRVSPSLSNPSVPVEIAAHDAASPCTPHTVSRTSPPSLFVSFTRPTPRFCEGEEVALSDLLQGSVKERQCSSVKEKKWQGARADLKRKQIKLGGPLSLPWGLYVLICQRTPEKPCLNDVSEVGKLRQTALIATISLVVFTLLPVWDELAEELGIGLITAF